MIKKHSLIISFNVFFMSTFIKNKLQTIHNPNNLRLFKHVKNIKEHVTIPIYNNRKTMNVINLTYETLINTISHGKHKKVRWQTQKAIIIVQNFIPNNYFLGKWYRNIYLYFDLMYSSWHQAIIKITDNPQSKQSTNNKTCQKHWTLFLTAN